MTGVNAATFEAWVTDRDGKALASAGGCEAQKLRFAFVYSVATAAFQVSMMFWGCLLDLRGLWR